MHELLIAVRRLLARPPSARDDVRADIDAYDARLGAVERDQARIAARLRLLERQADPRGIGRDDD